MSDVRGSGSEPEHPDVPPPPPMFPGQYGGGGGYGGPPGAQMPHQGQSGQYPQYPQYPASGAWPPPYGPPGARRGYSGWAIASFVTGLVLPLAGILVAVPTGIVGIVKTSGHRLRGRWMAVTGIALSVLWWAALISFGLWALNQQAQRDSAGRIDQAGTIDFSDVRVGDCITIEGLTGGGSIDTLKGVPCTEAHNAQAYWVVPMTGSDYPGETAVARQARQGCQPHFASYAAPGRQPYFLYPTSGLWKESGGHRAICFLIHPDRQPWTGSLVH